MNARSAAGVAWALGGVLLAPGAGAQLVAGNDQVANPVLWLVDLAGSPPRALVSGPLARATGVAGDESGRVLYWINPTAGGGWQLCRAPYTLSGALTPTVVGALPVSLTSLAFVPGEGVLYARGEAGLYQVSPATASATLVMSSVLQDFGGLDALGGSLYAANDSTLTGLVPGRGLYRVDPPWNAPTFTRLGDYPAGETDVDGLAAGAGRLYLVQDRPAVGIRVFNLATNAYEATLASPFTTNASVAGGAWAPGLLTLGGAADLRVRLTGPADCTTRVAGTLEWTAHLDNLGPDPANAAVLRVTLPAGATFVSSVPALTPASGVLTWNVGVLAPGATATLRVSVLPAAAGALGVSAQGSSQTGDSDPLNNAAALTTQVASMPPSASVARGVLSTIATSASSLAPGQGGARFSAVGGIGRPFKSETGARWIVVVDSDAPAASDSMILAGDAGTMAVVAREGSFPVLPTPPVGTRRPFGTFDPACGINDAGRFVFSGIDDRPTTTDDGYIVAWNGFAFESVARESEAAGVVGANVFWGAQRGSASIRPWGAVSFSASLSGAGVSASTDAGLFADHGQTLVARKGVSMPAGQAGGGTFTYKSFDHATAPGLGFSVDANAFQWSAAGGINASGTSPPPGGMDRVAVAGGEVVVQENAPVIAGGNARDTSPFSFVHTEPDGAWLAIGASDNGQEWVLRSWNVAARLGDVIDQDESWGANPSGGPAFYLACGNSTGRLVLGGFSDRAGKDQQVLALAGGEVVLRSNAPVDLDANGVFDDGVYVRSFKEHAGFLADDGTLYVVVTLRSEAAALCNAADADLGQALIRLTLPGPPLPCDPDVNQDGNVDQGDVDYLIDVVAGGPNPTGIDPDFTRDGNVDQGDVDALINVVAGGACP